MRMSQTKIGELATVKDIAARLKMSIPHVRDRVVRQPDFPRPVLGTHRARRWDVTDIDRWLSMQRAKNAR